MRFLFIDDSRQKDQVNENKEYVGYGGFCIDAIKVKSFNTDFYAIRKKYHIPRNIELKWSPDKDHFLNKKFKGSRENLFKEILLLLSKYDANILCAVHDINECHGVKLHNWKINQAILWATKEQFKYLVERLEKPYLEENDDIGLIITDHYSNRKEESNLIEQSKFYINHGTEFQKFDKICLAPLTTSSKDSPPIQLADLIIGITVGSLANSTYALKFFNDISLLFLKNPHKGAIGFDSTISSSVIGFGLKLFPKNFLIRGMDLFEQIDKKYIYTDKGIKERK
jgi:hypothetical protein